MVQTGYYIPAIAVFILALLLVLAFPSCGATIGGGENWD